VARRWAAVVLAGGRARRLDGVDKPALTAGGRSLLDGVLEACRGARPIVVVGPARPVAAPAAGAVRWAREEPPHGGPLAALVAGLPVVPPVAELTAVLAADLANLRPHTMTLLRRALRGAAGGAVLVDDTGRPQWLCGVWRTATLRAAVAAAGDPRDGAVRAVLAPLAPLLVAAEPGAAFDVDTPDDLRALRSRTGP
jgi:molybdopterin-guanine dinucleotide biosynthesis protein A